MRTSSKARQILGEDAFDALVRTLPGTELTSLLLDVAFHRAYAGRPADLVAQHRADRFCAPAPVDQRTLHAVDGHLLAAAEAFEAVELAPVTPLGACARVAVSDQRRVVSTTRATEVVSDPTNVLALECAARLRAGPDPVHLATSHRVVRAQPLPDVPHYRAHFRMFALASAGREAVDHGFTAAAVALHVHTLLAALDRLEGAGYRFGARRVEILATPARATLAARIAAAIGGAPATVGELDHLYYSGGLRHRVWVTAADGVEVPLGDGGTFDWLHRLAGNARLAFVASGLGSQLVPLAFGAAR